MLRKPVAFLVTLFALGFALIALGVVRWPTVMLAISLGWREQGADLSGFDWRALGLQLGGPALAAGVFFQISAFALLTRAHGAVTAFVFALACAAPVLAGLEASAADTIGAQWIAPLRHGIAGAAGLTLLAVWDLRARGPALNRETAAREVKPKVRRPPPPFVAVQRREWARQASRPIGPGRNLRS
jgi:hypothetical protein